MIKFRSLALAFHRAIQIRKSRELAKAQFLETKRLEQAAHAAQWAAEKLRRQADTLDADGSRAAAKAAREEQLKQERLDFIASQYAKIY